MTHVADGNTWFTLPGWTRAHEVLRVGSLGHISLWETACGREYRTDDHEYDDAPIQAPADLRRCASCARLADLTEVTHG